MFFNPIYLLINNNAKCLRNTLYLAEFLQTTLLLTIIYTLPIYIFSYIVTFSENKICNLISEAIYKYLYFIPSYLIIYTLHNSKLSKLLEKQYIVRNNPNHIYLSVLYGCSYIFFGITSFFFKKNVYLFHLGDTLSLSLFYNEVGYCFLDNTKYYYSNRLDFYNSNYDIFIFYSIITSVLISYIPTIYFIPVSYIITSIVQNIFIDYDYRQFNSGKTINIMYYFEKVINIIITFVSTFIFFSFQKRTIINEPI
jgi:hypothetical protein